MTESNHLHDASRIRFSVKNEGGQLHLTSNLDDHPSQLGASMAAISGGADMELATTLLSQVAQVISPERPDWAFNQAASLMSGLAPKTEQEGILVAQMSAVHLMAMHLLAKAAQYNQSSNVTDLCLGRANKLLNLYARQQELLDNKRNGKQTVQKVIVERVEVKDGGQAILGAVSQPRGGGR